MEWRWATDAAAPRFTRLAVLQGGFDIVTGLWPIFHLRSFEAMTGLRLERWLAKTMGALVTAIGGTLLMAGLRRRVSPEVRLLGVGSAATFAAMDTYTSRGRILPFPLLDAVAEVGLIAGWVWASTRPTLSREQQHLSPQSPLARGTSSIPWTMARGRSSSPTSAGA